MSAPSYNSILVDPGNIALADPDLLFDPEMLSDEDDLSDLEGLSDAETVLHAPRSPSPPPSPFPPASADKLTQVIPTEECLICKEEAPVTEYTTLPCAFGHRYMTSCILKWAAIQETLSSCPMCREFIGYKKCNHPLELARLEGNKSKISRLELQSRRCWLCRDAMRHERICRFYKDFLHGKPDWDILLPGDVGVLEQMFARDYTEKLQETKRKHVEQIETWRHNLQRYKNMELNSNREKDAAVVVSAKIFSLQYKLDELARVEQKWNKPPRERIDDRIALTDHLFLLEEERYRRTRSLRRPRDTPRESSPELEWHDAVDLLTPP